MNYILTFLYSADVNYFGTRKIINSHGFGDLFPLFRILNFVACVAGSNGSEMPGCDITCLGNVFIIILV